MPSFGFGGSQDSLNQAFGDAVKSGWSQKQMSDWGAQNGVSNDQMANAFNANNAGQNMTGQQYGTYAQQNGLSTFQAPTNSNTPNGQQSAGNSFGQSNINQAFGNAVGSGMSQHDMANYANQNGISNDQLAGAINNQWGTNWNGQQTQDYLNSTGQNRTQQGFGQSAGPNNYDTASVANSIKGVLTPTGQQFNAQQQIDPAMLRQMQLKNGWDDDTMARALNQDFGSNFNAQSLGQYVGANGLSNITGAPPPQTNPVQQALQQQQQGGGMGSGGGMQGYPQGQGNPYLQQMGNAITSTADRNYMQNIAPQLRSGAQMAGQYGGSRQGIAEGIAEQGLNQDTTNALANLYGQSYESGQNRNLQQNIANQQTGLGYAGLTNQMQLGQMQNQLGYAGLGNQLQLGQMQNQLGYAGLGVQQQSVNNQYALGQAQNANQLLGLNNQYSLGQQQNANQLLGINNQYTLGQGQLQLGKYQSDNSLLGSNAQAAAGVQAAGINAGASMHNADQQYQLGQGQLALGQQDFGLRQSNQNNQWALNGQTLKDQEANANFQKMMAMYGVGNTLNNQDWANLQQFGGIIPGAGTGSGTSSTTQQDPGTFGWMSALSDMRTKENVRRVGKTDAGVPIYIYNYIGDKTPQMGVMAQELEQINPDAVETTESGLKRVYYHMVK